LDRQLLTSGIISFVLLIVMLFAFARVNWYYAGKMIAATSQGAHQMFDPTGYGITLLILGVLLGASMIGGVYLAKEE